MREPSVALSRDSSARLFRQMEPAPNATVEQVRGAVLLGGILGCSADLGKLAQHKRMAGEIVESLESAVDNGRLFDLGYVPNTAIMSESTRAALIYSAGRIGHPYRDEYAIFHRWEEGAAVYVVRPEPDQSVNGAFAAAEFVCVRTAGRFGLILGDILPYCQPAASGKGYESEVVPSQLRGPGPFTDAERRSFASNVCDPVMAAILLLATDGVAVDRVTAPPKLQRARMKARKPALPGHWHVRTADYITALQAKSARGRSEPRGGHHASPVPHLRRGHLRTLADGRETWVRDCMVMLKDGSPIEGAPRRSFYETQREKGRSVPF